MPNAMRILSNHCKSKPTDRDTLSCSVGFLYTGYLTLTENVKYYVVDGQLPCAVACFMLKNSRTPNIHDECPAVSIFL